MHAVTMNNKNKPKERKKIGYPGGSHQIDFLTKRLKERGEKTKYDDN